MAIAVIMVKHDSIKGWRVICSGHGELAAYQSFWVAKRDADQHRESCEYEKVEPIPPNP